jgi:hypothetical protein
MGMTVMVIGWLYLFGGLSGGRRIVAASVLDRVVLVPLVLVPLAIAGVFPHFLLAFAVLEPTLGIGAWLLLNRSDRTALPGARAVRDIGSEISVAEKKTDKTTGRRQ